MNHFPLYRYELSKLFHQRFARISIMLALILTIVSAVYSTGFIYELLHPSIISDTYYQLPRCKSEIFYNYSEVYSDAYFAKVQAEQTQLNEEKMNFTEETAKQKGKYGLTKDMDAVLFSDLYSQCIYMQNCTQTRLEITQSAQSIIESETDAYLLQRAKLAEASYRKPLYLETFYDDGLAGYVENYLFFGRKSCALHIAVLLICFLCAGIFSAEHENGIFSMLYTTKKGRSRLFWAKYFASAIVVVVAVLSVQLIGFLTYAIRYYGIYGFDSSLQLLDLQMTDLSLCPFSLSNLQFLLICSGMQLLFFLLLLAVALLASIVFQKTVVAFLGSALLGISSAELFYYCKNNAGAGLLQTLENMQLMLPSALLFPECYFSQMNTVRIGEYAVYRIYILLSICFLLLVLLSMAAYLAYTKALSRMFRKRRRER